MSDDQVSRVANLNGPELGPWDDVFLIQSEGAALLLASDEAASWLSLNPGDATADVSPFVAGELTRLGLVIEDMQYHEYDPGTWAVLGSGIIKAADRDPGPLFEAR